MHGPSNLSDFRPQLLFVDDEAEVVEYLRRNLEPKGYEIIWAEEWSEARDWLKGSKIRPEIIFVEPVCKKGKVHLEVFREVRETARDIPLVAFTGLRDPGVIISMIQLGALDFVAKPFRIRELHELIEKILNRESAPVSSNGSSRSAGNLGKSDFICANPRMKSISKIALHVARTRVPVLITGESGVGKDVLARFIHQHSDLAGKPYVKVNCAAIPGELVESELFGYERGAFTGAYVNRPGKFEFANGGTIFLDEIGEFTPSVQAKLLQVLQDGCFTRLGSNREMGVDVRVIAATNRKLEEAIAQGHFREDLYYRLNVVQIEIPPLRMRKDEIPQFCENFLERFGRQYGSPLRELPPRLVQAFNDYHWPGNVRELENLVKRFLVLQDEEALLGTIRAKMTQDQFKEIHEMADDFLQHADLDEFDLKEISKKASSIVEKSMIEKALQKTNWNKWQAAKELKVSYKTLLTKIDEYGIQPAA